EIHPFDVGLARIRAMQPGAIILSGGPSSVYEPGAPTVDAELFALGVPVLGICYGVQLAAKVLGGEVRAASRREYGRAHVTVLGGRGAGGEASGPGRGGEASG